MYETDDICNKVESKENNLGYLMWRIMKLWQREMQKILDEFKTTTSQIEILGCIVHLNEFDKQEEVNQAQLSQFTDIDPMTTSTILRNLEKKGLVIRRQSLNDTRARSVFITDLGKKLFCNAIHKVSSHQNEFLGCINGDLIIAELQKLLFVLENRNSNDNDLMKKV